MIDVSTTGLLTVVVYNHLKLIPKTSFPFLFTHLADETIFIETDIFPLMPWTRRHHSAISFQSIDAINTASCWSTFSIN